MYIADIEKQGDYLYDHFQNTIKLQNQKVKREMLKLAISKPKKQSWVIIIIGTISRITKRKV